MFCATVSSSSRASSCGTTPRRALIWAASVAGSIPSTRRVPPPTGEVQPIIRIVEVFPAPFGPRKPKDSPAEICRSIPSTATKSPNVLRSPAASIIAIPAVSPALLLGMLGATVPPAHVLAELVHRADRLPDHPGWFAVGEGLVRGAATERGEHHVLGQGGGIGAEGVTHRLLELRVLHGIQRNRRRRHHRTPAAADRTHPAVSARRHNGARGLDTGSCSGAGGLQRAHAVLVHQRLRRTDRKSVV